MRPLQIELTIKDTETDEVLLVSGDLGILRNLVSGVKFYLPAKNTPNESEIVDAFVKQSGTRLDAIDRRCRTQAQDLYEAYVEYCEEIKHRPMSSTRLAREWERFGFERQKIASTQYWVGIQI